MAESRNEKKCPRARLKNDTLSLSDLTDEILLHILSFLPTKSVVATSLLSRRWQYLWAFAPNLQLDESQFNGQCSRFINFAERALLLREGSTLVSFSLRCSLRNYASRIVTLIDSATRHNVEQLSLNLWDADPSFFLPFCIFESQSLVKLNLVMDSFCSTIRVPSTIRLPRLKHLKLVRVEFVDNESTEKLLSHPLLEELIISNCTWCNVTSVDVNSPNLQRLEVDDWEESGWSGERQVRVLGDDLKFFRYDGETLPLQFCFSGSTMQLREAKILVDDPWCEFLDMDVASKLVNSLSMVQILTLSDASVQCIYELSGQFLELQTTIPVFERLMRLNLVDGPRISVDSAWLRMMFERCPYLEHLNFKTELNCRMGDPKLLKPVPSCFRTHLKKITVDSYRPKNKDQVDAISFLLSNASVLEEMVLHWKRDSRIVDQESQVAELEHELNARVKVSGNCKVSIVLV